MSQTRATRHSSHFGWKTSPYTNRWRQNPSYWQRHKRFANAPYGQGKGHRKTRCKSQNSRRQAPNKKRAPRRFECNGCRDCKALRATHDRSFRTGCQLHFLETHHDPLPQHGREKLVMSLARFPKRVRALKAALALVMPVDLA